MLTRVQIKNFRCLRDVDVPLKPLTVLIGPNNTGKSAFLSSVQLLAKAPDHKDGAFKVKRSDFYGFDESVTANIIGTAEGGGRANVSGGNRTQNQDGGFWIRAGQNLELSPVGYFCGSAMIPAMTSKGAQGIPVIDDQATNIPAVLDGMLRKDRERFDRIEALLAKHIPGLRGLNIETPTADSRRIDFVLEDGIVMDANLASHGVKLMIFFVVLANHPTPPRLVLIEEPETGVHPKRLEEIVVHLRNLIDGKYSDYTSQIILSTHSPLLLDYVDPELDQVLVFEREEGGSRSARPVDPERLKMFLHEFMLGEIWLNQEEAGLVEKS